MMRAPQGTSIWEGRFEDRLSFPVADLVMLPMENLTADVDDRLREWDGQGPVDQHLQAAIAGEHEALVLRLVGLARAEGRSFGWLAAWLRRAETMDLDAAVLPPAAYRARRLGRPDPGGTWHRATVWRMFRRLDFEARLADTRQALAGIVREAVRPDLYSRGLDWAAGQLNRLGVPTEHQTRLELVGLSDARGRWSRQRVRAFLVATSAAGLQTRETTQHQAAVWRRYVVPAWSDRARDAHRAACRARIAPLRAAGLSGRAIAEALNAAGMLTPSQRRAMDLGRAPPAVRWGCGSVLRLAA